MKFNRKLIIIPSMFLVLTVTSNFSPYSNVSKGDDTFENENNDVIRLKDGTTQASSADYCLLTFEANGGSWTGGISGTPTFQVRKGHNWARIKNKKGIPSKDNLTPPSSKEYKGWVDSNNKNVSDYYTFESDSVTFKAKWGEAYNPSTFESDTWDVFIQAADKGYDELTTKYSSAYSYGGHNTFIIQDIGDTDEVKLKTRYVTINGYKNPLRNDGKWPVRVIGENHDAIYGSYGGEVAALTFEFEYALYPSISYDYTTSHGHQSWDKSSLKNYLNTYLYYQFEDALKNGIQYVNKNTDNGYGVGEIESTKDILFLPSISEVSKNLDTSKYTSFENSLYGFYDKHQETSEVIKRNPFKLDESQVPTAISTWVRSPNLNRGKNACKAYKTSLSSNGKVANADLTFELADTNTTAGIAPCFAVGESNRVAYSFTGSGLSMIPVDKFADSTHGFKAKITVEDDSKYDVPTSIAKIKFTDSSSSTKELVLNDDYTYNNGTGELVVKPTAITTNKGKLEIFASPKDNIFKSDSWEDFIDYANQGLEGLKGRYGYDNYIGKYRYITIDGKSYKCRIIGQGEDTLADGTGKALLTFQFETVIGGEPLPYSSTNTNDFINSSLNNYLQSQLASYFPEGLKLVNKTVATKAENQGYRATTYATKIFPLSFSEMNLSASHPIDNEGDAYSYYKDIESYSPDFAKYLDNKKYTEVSHWLRSPASQVNADYVNMEGELRQDVECTSKTSNYVAPAFCVGALKTKQTATFYGTNYTIDGEANNSGPNGIVFNAKTGEQLKVTNIKPDKNYAIEKEDVTVTIKGKPFDDFAFKYDEVSKSYTFSIMKMPEADPNVEDENIIDVKVTIAPKGYFKLHLESDVTTAAGLSMQGTVSNVGLQYSTGGEFSDYTFGTQIPISPASPDIFLRAKPEGNATLSDGTNYCYLWVVNVSAKVSISGNMMYLLDPTGKQTQFKDGSSACFYKFLNGMTQLDDASSLILGGTSSVDTIAQANDNGIYCSMFENCSNLVKAPAKIEFTHDKNDKVSHVFQNMFRGCKKLEVAPVIEVPYLRVFDFAATFQNTGLIYAPNFDNQPFEDDSIDNQKCFQDCFHDCKELLEGPESFGTNLTYARTYIMGYCFSGCSKMYKAPAINFKLMYGGMWIYTSPVQDMFGGCSSLKTIHLGFEGHYNDYNALRTIFNGCDIKSIYLDNYVNGYNEALFANWLSGYTKPAEKGISYIYARPNMFNYFKNCIINRNFSYATILENIGIRNLETGEQYE